MTRTQRILLAVNLALIVGFAWVFWSRGNTEFLIYIGVTLFFIALIGATLRRVEYADATLVGLTLWSAMHLCGGGVTVGVTPEGDPARLYDAMLLPLSSTVPVIRYDQLVHVWGFGAATLVMFDLLRPALARHRAGFSAPAVVLAMAGLGVGALNEIVEFAVDQAVPVSGVGGYVNTSLDLVADLIGAVLAIGFIRWRSWPVETDGHS